MPYHRPPNSVSLAPQRRITGAPTPCRGHSAARLAAMSRDTPQLARLPMSQYTIVYCDTKKNSSQPLLVTIKFVYCDTNLAIKSLLSRYNDLYHNTIFPPSGHNTPRCIAIQSMPFKPFSVTIQNLYRDMISFSPRPVFQPWCHDTMTVS